MPSPIKVGILRETKVPQDTRVPLTPTQCAEALREYPNLKLVVQTSRCDFNWDDRSRQLRCYTDDEYDAAGVTVVENVDNCDIVIGIKEVKPSVLIPNISYLFFSHTTKAQPHNRTLLREVLARNIRLIDYELLVDESGRRVIAFGRWAGIVGAHNALFTWCKRQKLELLPRMIDIPGGFLEAQRLLYPDLAQKLNGLKIVLTGDGRVSNGCVEVLEACGIRRVSPEDFLNYSDPGAIFCQLPADKLYQKPCKVNGIVERMEWDEGFFRDPTGYISQLSSYLKAADVLINGIYWNERTAPLFTLEEMRDPLFRVKVISDITCDLVPNSSIPSTLKATTIDDPIFGFNPQTGREIDVEEKKSEKGIVWMTTIDNLPNELPKESSDEFGRTLINKVLPELLSNGPMIKQAVIADKGRLLPNFEYLQSFVDEN